VFFAIFFLCCLLIGRKNVSEMTYFVSSAT